jgi:hypothetical protein
MASRSPEETIHWIVFSGSPPSNCVDDFDAVTVLQLVLGKGAAGNEFFVNLHGDPLPGQFHAFDEAGDSRAGVELAGFPIDGDFHFDYG